MKLTLYTLLALCLLGSFAACKKDADAEVYDRALYFGPDTIAIRAYVNANKIPATKMANGIFYQIIAPGTGSFNYTSVSNITVDYEGKLLNGTVFDTTSGSTARTFTLGGLVQGWQIGVPLIQKGGKIRLIMPSYYGYQNSTANAGIPANSPLDFTISLIDVK